MKMCWKEFVKFFKIGDIFKMKYDVVSRVRYDRRIGWIMKIIRIENGYMRVGKCRSILSRLIMGNLVFVECLLDYCE